MERGSHEPGCSSCVSGLTHWPSGLHFTSWWKLFFTLPLGSDVREKSSVFEPAGCSSAGDVFISWDSSAIGSGRRPRCWDGPAAMRFGGGSTKSQCSCRSSPYLSTLSSSCPSLPETWSLFPLPSPSAPSGKTPLHQKTRYLNITPVK